MSTIEIWTGPMFAGKTTGLLDRVHFFRGAGVPVLLLKHASDDRYSEARVQTHSGVSLEAQAVGDVEGLWDRCHANPRTKVVAVDEVQFFGHAVVAWARDIRSQGWTVLLAGLDRQSTGEYFGPMPWLFAHADVVHKVAADCKCGLLARQTRRKKDAPEGWVGGSERYESVCWGCWYKEGGA